MELVQTYDHLEALLGRLGIRVRCELFDVRVFGDLNVRTGLCLIRGQPVVLVDARSSMVERVSVLAQVLSGFDIESFYVAPRLRSTIASHAARRLGMSQGKIPSAFPVHNTQTIHPFPLPKKG